MDSGHTEAAALIAGTWVSCLGDTNSKKQTAFLIAVTLWGESDKRSRNSLVRKNKSTRSTNAVLAPPPTRCEWPTPAQPDATPLKADGNRRGVSSLLGKPYGLATSIAGSGITCTGFRAA